MELTTTKNNLPVEVKGTWDSARQWHGAAGMFEQCKLYCQVMLGFELIALHKAMDVKRGGDQTGANRQDGGLLWGQMLEKEIALPETSARRFMDMAKASATRLKKLPLLHGFDPAATPIAQLSAPQKDALQTGVRKLTDGQTQKEFAEQLGLWKVPQGQNGGNPNPVPRRKLTIEEEAALLKQAAAEDWKAIAAQLDAYREKFVVMSDEDVAVQTAILEEALTARKTWLRQPLKARDPKPIAALFGNLI